MESIQYESSKTVIRHCLDVVITGWCFGEQQPFEMSPRKKTAKDTEDNYCHFDIIIVTVEEEMRS